MHVVLLRLDAHEKCILRKWEFCEKQFFFKLSHVSWGDLLCASGRKHLTLRMQKLLVTYDNMLF